MKRPTERQVIRSKITSYKHRSGFNFRSKKKYACLSKSNFNETIEIIKKESSLKYKISRRNIIINLPEVMNFNEHYERTVMYLNMIRRLAAVKPKTRKCLRLRRVDFSNLKNISSPAALVLTAELTKWDDKLNHRLKPEIENWNINIVNSFNELGYFDLFSIKPELKCSESKSNVRIAKYIRGSVGDAVKIRQLKSAIHEIVGVEIEKWMFLGTGLDEAITNVSHHAYPDDNSTKNNDKSWYMTGAFNMDTKELKVIFYDQGVGIPATLPSSTFWEKCSKTAESISNKLGLNFLDNYDSTMIKAAMEVSRTRTGEEERGKGLRDMLEFINQRGQGYLSILSLKGLYRCSISEDGQVDKAIQFQTPLLGTLIIWSVNLAVE